MPYPLYEKGQYNINHQQGIGLLCRLQLIYALIEDKEYEYKVKQELLSRFTQEQIDRALLKQKENEHIKRFYANSDKFKSKYMKEII